MTTRFWRTYSVVLLAVPLLMGQQGKLTGPVAGFVFDGSGRAVRPIQGVPGASLLGDPVDFGFEITSAWVSPRQDSAFVIGADRSLHLFSLKSGAAAEISLGGLTGVPQMVVFSPSGTAAALVAAGKVRVIQKLPDAPVLVGTVSLPESGGVPARNNGVSRQILLRSPAVQLAISDDGAYLLSAAAGSVRLLSTNGENRALLPAGGDALVAFAAGGHDAAVMDSAAGLVLFHDVAGTATQQPLAAADDSLAAPAGLAFSQDGRALYVASSGAHSVAAFDLAGGGRSAIPCECALTTLAPMGNLFRLNEPGAAPLWLLDAGINGPRIVFVPARSE
ncbi:MAG TPA: hypothetical protein VLY04_05935 [Bryobacteraceae bacterium]|nr:hypothetical protein [Bryobacteraceae bacterium]